MTLLGRFRTFSFSPSDEGVELAEPKLTMIPASQANHANRKVIFLLRELVAVSLRETRSPRTARRLQMAGNTATLEYVNA
jgi:hypothetical protein